jgi:hypothetical protein
MRLELLSIFSNITMVMPPLPLHSSHSTWNFLPANRLPRPAIGQQHSNGNFWARPMRVSPDIRLSNMLGLPPSSFLIQWQSFGDSSCSSITTLEALYIFSHNTKALPWLPLQSDQPDMHHSSCESSPSTAIGRQHPTAICQPG